MPREPRDRPWVVIFILLSLLAHLLFVVAIVAVSYFLPTPKLKNDVAPSSISLSLEPQPPAATSHTPPHRIFMPTSPDAGAKHQNVPIESDNDTQLKSKSQTARQESLLPDLIAKHKLGNLRDAPNSPSKTPPRPGATSQSQTQQKTGQQNNPSQTPTESTQNSQAAKPSPTAAKQPNPEKTTAIKIAPTVTYDPNGLPVLPPIAAPTLAPASQRQQAVPAASTPDVAMDTHGAVGAHGEDSPAAMATELGRYKAKVYRTVGSLWYHKVDQQFQLLPVGMVHIQFTIYKDGSVTTKVLEGDQGSLQILLSLSRNSILEAAPFDHFTDSMIRDVGDSYTDDFSFSIYGGN